MKLEAEVFCDAPDCENRWHAGLTRFNGRTLNSLPPGYLLVREFSDGAGQDAEYIFCDSDCCMKWCAQYDPPEVITDA